jgi:hypothetical protein
VIHEHASGASGLTRNDFSVHRDRVARRCPIAELRGAAVDGYAASLDPAFDFPTGTEPGRGQELLEPLSR